MNKIILFLVLFTLLSVSFSFLVTPSKLKKYLAKSPYSKLRPMSNISINTTCNALKLDQQPKAYAYSGYLKAFDTTSNSAFGFIFYGSQ